MTARDIPITVIAGYLGAGKTTLINRLLNQTRRLPEDEVHSEQQHHQMAPKERALHELPDTRLAVLVNDFGDVNIDETLIRSRSDDQRVIGLSNGCVCCTLQEDFGTTLEQLKDYDVQHVIMEASGVGMPDNLRSQCHYPGFYPASIRVLVDASAYAKQCQDKYVGHLVQEQVSQADVITVSKIDLNPDFELPAQAQARVLSIAETPTSFTSITLLQCQSVTKRQLTALLDALPSWVQRVKGFVNITDRFVLVQQVSGHCELEPVAPLSPCHLVFIAPLSKHHELAKLINDHWCGSWTTP